MQHGTLFQLMKNQQGTQLGLCRLWRSRDAESILEFVDQGGGVLLAVDHRASDELRGLVRACTCSFVLINFSAHALFSFAQSSIRSALSSCGPPGQR